MKTIRQLVEDVVRSINIDNNLQWQVGDLIQHYQDETLLKLVSFDEARQFTVALDKNGQEIFFGSQKILEQSGYKLVENQNA